MTITAQTQVKDRHKTIRHIKAILNRWHRNFTTRRQLRELTDDNLKDIGIDHQTAIKEANKPFWHD